MEEKHRSSATLLNELARWNKGISDGRLKFDAFFFLSFFDKLIEDGNGGEENIRKRYVVPLEQTFVNLNDNGRWRRLEQFRLIPPFNRAIELATNSNVHESFAMGRLNGPGRFRIFAPFYDKNWNGMIINWGEIFVTIRSTISMDEGRLRWLKHSRLIIHLISNRAIEFWMFTNHSRWRRDGSSNFPKYSQIFKIRTIWFIEYDRSQNEIW